MRVPLTYEVDGRDGTSTKDSKLVNVLQEKEDTGTLFAAIRPALVNVASTTGAGSGTNTYNGTLLTVYGTTLRYSASLTSVTTVAAGFYDFCQST